MTAPDPLSLPDDLAQAASDLLDDRVDAPGRDPGHPSAVTELAASMQAVRAALRQPGPIDDELRRRHLAAAVAAGVVDLDAQRRRRRTMAGAVAAAAAVVIAIPLILAGSSHHSGQLSAPRPVAQATASARVTPAAGAPNAATDDSVPARDTTAAPVGGVAAVRPLPGPGSTDMAPSTDAPVVTDAATVRALVASRLGASGPSPTLADPCPDVAGTALADVTANGTPAVVILLGPANAPTQALVLASVDCRQLLSVTLGP